MRGSLPARREAVALLLQLLLLKRWCAKTMVAENAMNVFSGYLSRGLSVIPVKNKVATIAWDIHRKILPTFKKILLFFVHQFYENM